MVDNTNEASALESVIRNNPEWRVIHTQFNVEAIAQTLEQLGSAGSLIDRDPAQIALLLSSRTSIWSVDSSEISVSQTASALLWSWSRAAATAA